MAPPFVVSPWVRPFVPAGHLCHGCAWSISAFAAAQAERHPDRAREEPLRW